MAPKKKAVPPKPVPDKIAISVRLNGAHLRRLDKLAAAKGMNRSSLIQLAIAEKLEREGA